MFSPDVLLFLGEMLGRVQLSAADPGFEETAAVIVKAKRELNEAAAALTAVASPDDGEDPLDK